MHKLCAVFIKSLLKKKTDDKNAKRNKAIGYLSSKTVASLLFNQEYSH